MQINANAGLFCYPLVHNCIPSPIYCACNFPATYHGLYTPSKEVHPRYPNYLPQLRAQRQSTAKEDAARSQAIRTRNEQIHNKEMARNRMYEKRQSNYIDIKSDWKLLIFEN